MKSLFALVLLLFISIGIATSAPAPIHKGITLSHSKITLANYPVQGNFNKGEVELIEEDSWGSSWSGTYSIRNKFLYLSIKRRNGGGYIYFYKSEHQLTSNRDQQINLVYYGHSDYYED